MSALTKLSKQHEQTWINLQKRLKDIQFDHSALLPEDVHASIKNKATSVGSCDAYFIPTLLTTTAFLLANNSCKVDTVTHKQPLNIYTLFVGYPGTGMTHSP